MMRWIFGSSLLIAAALAPLDARAGDVVCPGSLGAVTIDGNLIVNGPCSLAGTRVKGNVFVEPRGQLLAKKASIEGNVQSQGGARVRLVRTEVDGDVQLFELTSDKGSVVQRSSVGGSVQLEDNRSPLSEVESFVGSDVQVNANRGGAVIYLNVIGGNLQCQSNVPPPTGGQNQVGGSKEDQCEAL
jgi:hypothetical protein